MPIAFFDVDGTLIDGASSERRFLADLARCGRLGPRQALAALWFFARWSARYGRHTPKRNKAYLAGLPVAEIEELAADFVRVRLASRLRAAVVERLARHREVGETVILLTGTPDFIAAPLAALLEADGHVSTRCAAAGGHFLAAPPVCHPFAAEKLSAARRACIEAGVPLHRCTAYGDSIFDLPLLDEVGLPVAVAPDAALRRVALDRGWEVLNDGRRGPNTVERPGWQGHLSRYRVG